MMQQWERRRFTNGWLVLATIAALCALFLTPGGARAQGRRRPMASANHSQKGTLVITGYSGQSVARNAEGRDVVVNGDNQNVQIRGRARELRVSGTNNHVRINAVRAIQVTGSRNRVLYYAGYYKNVTPRMRIAAGNTVDKAH